MSNININIHVYGHLPTKPLDVIQRTLKLKLVPRFRFYKECEICV